VLAVVAAFLSFLLLFSFFVEAVNSVENGGAPAAGGPVTQFKNVTLRGIIEQNKM
jgi:hypothetical protein